MNNTDNTTVIRTETTCRWEDLTPHQVAMVIAAHMPLTQFVKGSEAKKKEKLLRLFNLG